MAVMLALGSFESNLHSKGTWAVLDGGVPLDAESAGALETSHTEALPPSWASCQWGHWRIHGRSLNKKDQFQTYVTAKGNQCWIALVLFKSVLSFLFISSFFLAPTLTLERISLRVWWASLFPMSLSPYGIKELQHTALMLTTGLKRADTSSPVLHKQALIFGRCFIYVPMPSPITRAQVIGFHLQYGCFYWNIRERVGDKIPRGDDRD